MNFSQGVAQIQLKKDINEKYELAHTLVNQLLNDKNKDKCFDFEHQCIFYAYASLVLDLKTGRPVSHVKSHWLTSYAMSIINNPFAQKQAAISKKQEIKEELEKELNRDIAVQDIEMLQGKYVDFMMEISTHYSDYFDSLALNEKSLKALGEDVEDCLSSSDTLPRVRSLSNLSI